MPEEISSSGSRIDARERALELLYEAEMKGVDPDVVLAELPLAPDSFCVELLTGVAGHLDEIDAEVSRVSKGWEIRRMPVIDRSVLRLGTYELRWSPDVPTAVVINEAVELARRFSTERSSKFVNGVLSRLATDLR